MAPIEASLIDICVPTFEPDSSHLHATLASALAQTETRWTLLVHDDASQTDVRAIVEPFMSDSRIRFERSVERRGIGGNWNASIRAGSASFVQLLFQDDTWHPAYLEKSLRALDLYPQALLTLAQHSYVAEGDPASLPDLTRYRTLEEGRARITPGPLPGKGFLRAWIDRGLTPNVIGEPSFVMLRRDALERVGLFREDMPQGLDMEMWVRILLEGDIAFLSENLGTFRIHPAGASARNDQAGEGLYDRLQCFDLLLRRLPSGPERAAANAALKRELQTMIAKFLARRSEGRPIGRSGTPTLFSFALRHPFKLTAAFAGHLLAASARHVLADRRV